MFDKEFILEPFHMTFVRLEYIKYITFGVIMLIAIFTLFVVFRYSIQMSSSFELPINKMCLFMEKLDLENLEEENIEKFEKYFTCQEIKNLFEAIIKFVNNIKFSNQIFTEDDA